MNDLMQDPKVICCPICNAGYDSSWDIIDLRHHLHQMHPRSKYTYEFEQAWAILESQTSPEDMLKPEYITRKYTPPDPKNHKQFRYIRYKKNRKMRRLGV